MSGTGKDGVRPPAEVGGTWSQARDQQRLRQHQKPEEAGRSLTRGLGGSVGCKP